MAFTHDITMSLLNPFYFGCVLVLCTMCLTSYYLHTNVYSDVHEIVVYFQAARWAKFFFISESVTLLVGAKQTTSVLLLCLGSVANMVCANQTHPRTRILRPHLPPPNLLPIGV